MCTTLLLILNRNIPSDVTVASLAAEPDAFLVLSLVIGAVVVNFTWIPLMKILEWVSGDRGFVRWGSIHDVIAHNEVW